MTKLKTISIFPNYTQNYSYYYNLIYNIKKQFGLNYGKTFKLLNYLGFNKKSTLHYQNKKSILILNFILNKKFNINKLYIIKFLYFNLKKLINTKSRKGIRHTKNLPVNGQRTHTNNDTQKRLNRIVSLQNLFNTKLYHKTEKKYDKNYNKRNYVRVKGRIQSSSKSN